jgi:hypothetical protein
MGVKVADLPGTTNLGDLELARAGIQAREIDSESAAAGAVLTADGAGGVAWQAAASGGGKKYVALLAQSDEDAPVATVLENTLGGAIAWTRQGYACYRATLTGAFPAGKTLIKASLGRKSSDCWWAAPQWLSEGTFNVYTTDNSGSQMEGFQELLVEVYVYP